MEYKAKYKTQWKQNIVDRVSKWDNETLLEEVLDQARGDSWEGGFTRTGRWEYGYIKHVLRDRLAGWLESATGLTDANQGFFVV